MPIDVAAEVIANRPLSADYNVLALAAPAIAAAAAPGQFVMVKIESGSKDPLLRRPFSLFEVLRGNDGTPTGITLLNKRIGPTTSLIYTARPGQVAACLGPLGRPFTIVDPPGEAWMVAGGVGLAPFAALAEALRARSVKTTLFYGARKGDELFYLDFFRALGVELLLTTEDGSAGERGRVVAPLERRLTDRPPAAPVMIYACGPHHGLRPRRLLQLRRSHAWRRWQVSSRAIVPGRSGAGGRSDTLGLIRETCSAGLLGPRVRRP
jgi:dihydroorotate dehydrogenase electron transfer subunit